MKVSVKGVLVILALVTILKVTGLGDFLVNAITNPGDMVPSVEIGR